MRKNIIILGSNGQLGKELQQIKTKHNTLFASREEIDITDTKNLKNVLSKGWDYCINASAYTAVDKAEEEQKQAFLINSEAVDSLAKECHKQNIKLIHISTDYVFNGKSETPYRETDETDPINTYGASKLKGEQLALQNNPQTFIIRTAWVYSEFGNNFVKTMLRVGANNHRMRVVNDQFGSPTYARDLARVIFKIIDQDSDAFGTYHYSNEGKTHWAEFAQTIFDIKKLHVHVQGIPATEYPTPAARPYYSLLDKTKITKTFGLTIPHWKDSLKEMLENFDLK
ncbi:dTDP-4-dehydrorhamnose reductase [Flavobacteriaceae bacterium UJ101]|nr:dTDP-4-dehydrorhamnose reductase [Flavobacteriaceae bacterium UJ101]